MQTIIHRTTAYVDYPFESISPALLLELQSSVISLTKKKYKNEGMNLLRCLECYLQITDQQLNIKSLEGNLFIQITNSFIGALASGIFIRNSLRSSYITTWHSVMDELKIRFPNLKVVRLKSKFVPNGIDIDPLICQFKSKVLNEEKLWVWRGWITTNKSNDVIMLPLYPIFCRLGRNFTQKFFEVLDSYCRARRVRGVPCIKFLLYLYINFQKKLRQTIF